MDRELQKREAIERLKILCFDDIFVDIFSRGTRNLFSIDNGYLDFFGSNWEKRIKAVEEKYKVLVYHVMRSDTSFGKLLILLVVSDCKEDWKLEREQVKAFKPLAYVINLDDEACSEFGSVLVKPQNGGLVRIAWGVIYEFFDLINVLNKLYDYLFSLESDIEYAKEDDDLSTVQDIKKVINIFEPVLKELESDLQNRLDNYTIRQLVEVISSKIN